MWLVVPLIARFLDYQYLWKESSDICFCICFFFCLFFVVVVVVVVLRGDSHQRKLAPETTKFWLVVVCCVSYLIRLKAS